MEPEKDYVDLLRLFNEHRVQYCIVGSHALAFHARPRYTKDIDILIGLSEENAERVIQALTDFGFESLGLVAGDLTKPDSIIQLGYEPVRIDIITSLGPLDLAVLWKNCVEGLYGDEKVLFIGFDDLVKAKKAAGRYQDLADLEILLKAKEGTNSG